MVVPAASVKYFLMRSKMSLLTSEKSFLTGRPRLPEKHSQAFGQTERHESVWKTREKIILGVLGEQEGSFLGTGRLRVAVAHHPGDTLGIVAT